MDALIPIEISKVDLSKLKDGREYHIICANKFNYIADFEEDRNLFCNSNIGIVSGISHIYLPLTYKAEANALKPHIEHLRKRIDELRPNIAGLGSMESAIRQIENIVKKSQQLYNIQGWEEKKDAVEFSEWVSNNQFTFDGNIWTSTKIHYLGGGYAPAELYTIFTQQKQ